MSTTADAARRRCQDAPAGGEWQAQAHRYLNMDDLREHKKEVLRMAA